MEENGAVNCGNSLQVTRRRTIKPNFVINISSFNANFAARKTHGVAQTSLALSETASIDIYRYYNPSAELFNPGIRFNNTNPDQIHSWKILSTKTSNVARGAGYVPSSRIISAKPCGYYSGTNFRTSCLKCQSFTKKS
jgi:hypothetical protein